MSIWVLGLNLGHDRSVCLLQDGNIFVAIEEERLDKVKHSLGHIFGGYCSKLVKEIPIRGITYCLEYAGISLDEVDLVVGNCAANDISLELLKDSLPIKDKSKIVKLPNPSHHLAHAYCTYYVSGFDESLIFISDGMGSFVDEDESRMESESLFLAKNGEFKLINQRQIDPKHKMSLGLFYNYVTSQIGFVTPYGKENFGEFSCGGIPEAGKTMGLSPYGKHNNNWSKIIKNDNNGNIDIDFRRLYQVFELSKSTAEIDINEKKYNTQFYRDWAFKVQEELEDTVISMLNSTYTDIGISNLCLSGGVFLNSVLNYKIKKHTQFKDIYVFSATNDAGVAVGCAYYGYYNFLKQKNINWGKRTEQVGFGKIYTEKEIEECIRAFKFHCKLTSTSEIANFISDGKIVALFYGRSEFGPRALGHRSILASAQISDMKDILNKRVKFRENFRPFAPAVLYEDVNKHFELDFHSPYMLFVAPVKDNFKNVLPSVTHVDGTARLQTVTSEVGVLYDIIQSYKELTDIGVVLNTSFNINGQPIVETPMDAITTFLKTDIDILVLWPYILVKEDK